MADGTVIIDTLIDTKGFGKGVGNMKSQFSQMGGIVKKLGTTIAAAFSVRAIVNFAKEAINLGSDLQEVQNVVDVTFGDLNSQINEFAKNAITQFGLSELSAKQYASTLGAIFKSSGFSVEQAASMSQTLTGLAGDIASFYNLTSDEAFSKLRGGITGETEPLKQLGINLSAANLEAYALSQGITKTYDAMSQQEKMMLRYNYILSVTADAQGDFARTSESWANQTRILSEQFNSIKATIGQGLINAFTPVIKVINTVLIGLQKLANAFAQFTALLFGNAGGSMSSGAGSVANSFGAAADSAEDMAAATGAAAKAAKILSGLDEINTFSSGKGGGGGGAAGSDLFTDINLPKSLTKAADLSNTVSSIVGELVEAVKAGDWYTVGSTIAEKINGAIDQIDTESIAGSLSDIITNAFNTGSGFLDGLDGKKIGNKIYYFFRGLKWGEIIRAIINFVGSAFNLAEEIVVGILEPMAEDIEQWFEETFTEDGELTAESFLNGMRTTFGDIGTWVDTYIFKPFDNAFGSKFLLGALGGSGWSYKKGELITQGLYKGLSNLPGKAGEIFGELYNISTNKTEKLKEWLGEAWEFIKQGAIGGFAAIPDGIVGAFSTLKSKLQFAINNYIILPFNMFLKKLIDGVNSVIDSVNSIGSAIGLKKLNIGRVSMVSIPYLAKGAVIPPNAPFMAMLGDQRRGNNLEAPESLIRQIVREESGGGNGNYRFVAQINRRVLFDEMIAEAKLRQSATGRDPFALA